MTDYLKRYAKKKFALTVLQEAWQPVEALERLLLQLNATERVMSREVILACDDQPILYAKTWISESLWLDPALGLNQLGDKPLGEILFKNSINARKSLEWALLTPATDLYQAAIKWPMVPVLKKYWARRSVLSLQSQLLLIYEVLLTDKP